ncbi:hypothetical protein GCE9029_00981 [Grimontia celer]|uniref:Uncharacterized protein n=1 Tax=Grimontia celer TaxID=1796497 RepID=A0A128EWZ1_9GAMM|nr:hypothetical protein [Grimontia celer]CZF78665.1 hypothetical protein GCE9029_00981 [Grimontia celer]
MEQHVDINLTRVDEMRKSMIVNRTCAVIAKASNGGNPRKTYVLQSSVRQGAPVDETEIRAIAKKLSLSLQEQDLFVVIKRNLVHSKKVKDGQISAFAKHVVLHCDEETDIYHSLKGIEQQMQVMDQFIQYIHV